jgi:two-component system, cell cycle sensor histidine kinase and response regulator CckA
MIMSAPPLSLPKSPCILFVDDEQSLRIIAERLLTRLGYAAVTAESAQEALAILKAEPNRFDLVITDQNMPEMLGLELIGKIRKLHPKLKIILATGYAEEHQIETARSLGVSEIIQKPYNTETLSTGIKRALGH